MAAVVTYLSPSIKSLATFRDQHALQKSESSKVCLGVSEDGGSRNYNEFLESLTGPYPRLLAHLYEFLRDKSIGKPKFSTDESAKFSAEVLSHQQNHNGEIIELKSENKPSGGAGETSNTRVGTSQDVKRLMAKALRKALTNSEKQQVPALVENNPPIAVDVFLMLIKSRHVVEYFKVLVKMEVSLHNMEVVNLLSTQGEFPAEFIHLYIQHCLASCESTKDGNVQTRLVRIVSIFIQSLLRNRIIGHSFLKEIFIDLQAFCIQFSHTREAAGLFRLLKEIDCGETDVYNT
ncbi:unnamed protein product [Clavelina lepadiformis]|uniref:CCR4-NOT transcription complex subunit 11 n=1 Tax=Clavelina lepadiformis TaxID=159417 RepID=A0ABP0FU86_CLALP